MAALSKAQWYAKIRSWVPDWVFENEQYQKAVFSAIAQLLSEEDSEMRTQLEETFIATAVGTTLDQHGYERTIPRYSGELDANYSLRIRNMTKSLDPISIAAVATQFLLTGSATVWEHDVNGTYFDDSSFLDRREIYSDINYCSFTIVVPYQGVDDTSVLIALGGVATAINGSKALGTFYAIVELLSGEI